MSDFEVNPVGTSQRLAALEAAAVTHFDDGMVNYHLDAVLRASGSAMRHYTMEKTVKEMREAMRKAMAAAVQHDFSAGES